MEAAGNLLGGKRCGLDYEVAKEAEKIVRSGWILDIFQNKDNIR